MSRRENTFKRMKREAAGLYADARLFDLHYEKFFLAKRPWLREGLRPLQGDFGPGYYAKLSVEERMRRIVAFCARMPRSPRGKLRELTTRAGVDYQKTAVLIGKERKRLALEREAA